MPAALVALPVETVNDVPATMAEIYKALAEPCSVAAEALLGVKLILELDCTAGCVIVVDAAAAKVNEP